MRGALRFHCLTYLTTRNRLAAVDLPIFTQIRFVFFCIVLCIQFFFVVDFVWAAICLHTLRLTMWRGSGWQRFNYNTLELSSTSHFMRNFVCAAVIQIRSVVGAMQCACSMRELGRRDRLRMPNVSIL